MGTGSEQQRYWLMKCEPAAYTIEDLARDGRAEWEGVRNYQARNLIRDEMRQGDRAVFYRSNGNPSAAVGLMHICTDPYPDETQYDPESEYYDSKATRVAPRWWRVDVCYENTFPRAVPLDEIKRDAELDGILVGQKGNRLSIQPLSRTHFERIVELGNTVTF